MHTRRATHLPKTWDQILAQARWHPIKHPLGRVTTTDWTVIATRDVGAVRWSWHLSFDDLRQFHIQRARYVTGQQRVPGLDGTPDYFRLLARLKR